MLLDIIIKIMFYINFIVLLVYGLLYLTKLKAIKKQKIALKKRFAAAEPTKAKEKKNPVLVATIFLITTGIIIGLTSIVWIPVIVWISNSFKMAFIVFSSMLILFSFIYTFVLPKVLPQKYTITEGIVVREFMFVFLVFYVLIFILFGWHIELESMMALTYNSVIVFKNTFTILLPIIMSGIIVTNIFIVFNGLIILSRQRRGEIAWKKKINDFVLILNLSAFIGVLYVTEMRFSFIDEGAYASFKDTLIVFIIFLSTLLIPIVFKKITFSVGK